MGPFDAALFSFWFPVQPEKGTFTRIDGTRIFLGVTWSDNHVVDSPFAFRFLGKAARFFDFRVVGMNAGIRCLRVSISHSQLSNTVVPN